MTTEKPEWPRHIQPGDALCGKCHYAVRHTWVINTYLDPLAIRTCVRCGMSPIRILVRDEPAPKPTT